ncbi:hypothetical protein ACF07T_41330 [Streptomyces sp. NPDC015184]|uniref:hypothetical protein n=1 Tax=Streptomyces sp. NPDC015184 TaxID=3364946 RepID=UPI0036F508BC
MTPDHSNMPAAALMARAEYDTDWHVYIDAPQGPLGYCTDPGTGVDEDFDFAAPPPGPGAGRVAGHRPLLTSQVSRAQYTD